MVAVEVSIVHDHHGSIISVAQFAAGVKAMVLGGDGQSVLVTTVDHALVPELIRTHKVDVGQGRLVEIAGTSSHAARDRDALAALLLPKDSVD
jgi:hypothetical protein